MPNHKTTTDIDSSPDHILVLGNGRCAAAIAADLHQLGRLVTVAAACGPDECSAGFALKSGKGPVVLYDSHVTACRGNIGDFQITLTSDGIQSLRRFEAIIIAPETIRRPNCDLYDLTPSESVLSLSQLIQPSRADTAGNAEPSHGITFDGIRKGTRFLFLTGLVRESNPVISGEVMRAALDLQSQADARCFVLTGNVKVAASGLEKLYYDSRCAGVAYFKPAGELPRFELVSGKLATVSFFDDTVQKQFQLTPDLVVADETILPSPELADLIQVFGLEADPSGFAQTGNVHRLAVHTNRPGILVAGPGRKIQSRADQITDARNAVLAVLDLDAMIESDPVATPVRIDTDRCVHCLTCFRLCPYGAVDLSDHTLSISNACQSCYLCSAECPRQAISIVESIELKIPNAAKPEEEPSSPSTFNPRLVAFACRRSALPAAEMASRMGETIPPGLTLIPVPCAGGIGLPHILNAFDSGADGVLLLTCHDGNCHSEKGSRYARQRVEHLSATLSQMGMAPQRLTAQSLAANMGVGFARGVAEFEDSIRRQGPL